MERLKNIVLFVMRLILAAIFIWAGVEKLLRPDDFFTAIESYQIIHGTFALLLAYFLPPFEILCGLSLCLKRYQKAGLILIFTMTAVFVAAIVSALARGIDINCGCFGGGSDLISNYSEILLRDLAILIAVLIVQKLEHSRQ